MLDRLSQLERLSRSSGEQAGLFGKSDSDTDNEEDPAETPKAGAKEKDNMNRSASDE